MERRSKKGVTWRQAVANVGGAQVPVWLPVDVSTRFVVKQEKRKSRKLKRSAKRGGKAVGAPGLKGYLPAHSESGKSAARSSSRKGKKARAKGRKVIDAQLSML